MTLGQLLRAKRMELELTLDEVSQAAGISKSYLWEVEQGKSIPSIVICARLSIVLDLRISVMAATALRSDK